MIKIEPDFRTVAELEEEWDCKIYEIFNWASQGLLKIWETDRLRICQESDPISKEKANEIFHTLTLDGQDLFDHLEMDFNPQAFRHYTGNGFAIKNEDIQRFEQRYKEPESKEERKLRIQKKREEEAAHSEAYVNAMLFPFAEEPTKTQEPDNGERPQTQNTPDHPYHAKELAIANLCWANLYMNRQKNDHTQKVGHKKMIENWLEKNYPGESESLKDRVSTIVNPNKRGGAPKIG